MPIRVLGIDPSTKATGLALPHGALMTVSPQKGEEDIAGRLHEIYCRASGIFQQLTRSEAVDVAVIEYVIPQGSNTQAVARARLSELAGVLKLALYEAAIPFAEINPISLKKYATDNGGAQKTDMVKAAKELGAKVTNDNEADAFFLRKIGHDYYNFSPAQAAAMFTAYQIELHDRTVWPKL